MSESRFVLPEPENVTMSGDAARRLVGCGSGDAALLYIHILLSGGRFDRDDAAAHTGRTPDQMDAAMEVLRRLGLVSVKGGERPAPVERPDELPQYTAQDIKRELENGQAFPALVDEVQHALGKVLSSDDLVRLFGIYDYLGLPPDVILQLVCHCLEEYRRRYGPGRTPTMRYIEKAAYTWEREGIFSLEAAESYLKRLDRRLSGRGSAAEAMGIQGRTLSASESRYIDSWTDMGFPPEAIAIAYDRTVLKTGRLTWRYMDSILRSWHGKGLHTPEEIAAGDGPRPGKAPAKDPGTPAGGATAQELRRMRETLKKLRDGE